MLPNYLPATKGNALAGGEIIETYFTLGFSAQEIVLFLASVPELSRKMAYKTRNTVNSLARKEFNLNSVVLDLSKEKETYTSSSRNISSIR